MMRWLLPLVVVSFIIGGAAAYTTTWANDWFAQSEEGLVEQSPDGLQTTIVVGDEEYEVTVEEGSTALDAMERAQAETDFSFAGEEMSFGLFVNTINGTISNESNFWSLYINGAQAQTGASGYTVQEGDTIEWRYEAVQM
ncbi:MAG: DUF4430 domain-containing protein [Candidatus Spechtbacterales bacterium]